MSVELPATSAVVARLAEAEIHLAAYGGVVFPLALIIESPVIMLLAASTALSRDWDSFARLRRFMLWTGGLLTGLHALIAFTPLYGLVVAGALGVPAEVVEPARLGLMIMTPWTWSIAYRRFYQGVLIRFGQSRAVGQGTLVRLAAAGGMLALGYLSGRWPGVVVAASAASAGVMAEAAYIGWRVRAVVRGPLRLAPAPAARLTFRALLDFYVPLAMTSLLILIAQPMGSAALSRMPNALTSLALWPVVSGVGFLMRSFGLAFNEVVVALLDEPGSAPGLRRFMLLLSGLTTAALFLLAATPLSAFWFGTVAGLTPPLAEVARRSLWIALPMPALSVLQSWFQGALVHSRRTRGVTEAVVVYLLVSVAVLWAGVAWGQIAGLYVALAAFTTGSFLQTAWLQIRSRGTLRALQARDSAQAAATL